MPGKKIVNYDDRLTILLPKTLKEEFISISFERRENPSELIRQFIKDHVKTVKKDNKN